MIGRSLLIPALLLGASLPVSAQTASPPPHLSVLDGRATLTRGQDREDAIANTPLTLGDRLSTEYGRAEVLMGDGTALHLDESTTVDLNGDSVVRLLSGRLIVLATTASSGAKQRMAPAAMASSPMYRCRNPRILPRLYSSTHFSSKRRMRSM